MKKHVVGVCFVLAKKPTEGMAKKVGVQEEERVEGLPTTFSFTLRLLLKDSPSFYEQNEAAIIGKKYK